MSSIILVKTTFTLVLYTNVTRFYTSKTIIKKNKWTLGEVDYLFFENFHWPFLWLHLLRVMCKCGSCGSRKQTLSEWEKHTGCRAKKWKHSVKVKSTMLQLEKWVCNFVFVLSKIKACQILVVDCGCWLGCFQLTVMKS